MPRKAFLEHLRDAAACASFPRISNVRKGDDDGDFKFSLASEVYPPGFEIECKLSDVSDYPSGHICYFIAPDNAPEWLAKAMESLFDKSNGQSIASLLQLASRAAARFADSEGDVYMTDSQDVIEISDSDDQASEQDLENEEGEDLFFPEEKPPAPVHAPSSVVSAQSKADSKFRERIRADFSAAKASGFKLAYSDASMLQGTACYVSLSCRIKKLGISEEAMEAWRLSPSEYLILMLRYPLGYKPLDELLAMDPVVARRALEIRSGVSHTYRPTFLEFVHAFIDLAKDAKDEFNAIRSSPNGDSSHGLRPSFITKPLDGLMNERLFRIITFREAGLTWTGAAGFYNDYVNSGANSIDAIPTKYMEPEQSNKVFPEIVNADHITECGGSTQAMSFPLIAMQFFLRHFVRCTEYCLVCFQPLPDMFEAIKPYVCDKPLCLYQYMNLGFGPSVEHEILTQPYVVDLLISFCYTGANNSSLNSFPAGLGLMVPDLAVLGSSTLDDYKEAKSSSGTGSLYYMSQGQTFKPVEIPSPPQQCRYNRAACEMLFDGTGRCPLKNGEWIIMGSSQYGMRQHCRVKSVALYPTVRVSEPFEINDPKENKPEKPKLPKKGFTGVQAAAPSTVESRFEDCFFYTYDRNFDELPDLEKQKAIGLMLRLMPGVVEMKSYLNNNPTATLSTWTDRLSPTLLGLLRWIVASCRACILEMDDKEEENTVGGGRRKVDRVYGMPGYRQFKFAMGAPDKERRFVEAVKAVKLRKSLEHATIFAWHGSPLKNWHSIIREGLHFKTQAHGRAFGNGVYFSLDLSTSLGYSGMYSNNPDLTQWPQSTLMVNNAIALNEIANAPDEFVSRNPHLVVSQLDWIQTRFLFVKVPQTSAPIGSVNYSSHPVDVPMPTHPFPQDPKMTPRGELGKAISIPFGALGRSSGLRDKEFAKLRANANISAQNYIARPAPSYQEPRKKRRLFGIGSAVNPIVVDGAGSASNLVPISGGDDDDNSSVCTLEEDLAIFKPEKVVGRSEKTAPEGKLPKRPLDSTPRTDFVPGSLDHSTLPVLSQPSWATISATKRLQSDFRALLKVQNKEPLDELGWYIDPESISSMYQWIIELHSFERQLPLASDMKQKGLKSVVLEFRFGKEYPMSPPFVRVVRPRFKPFQQGGGGHVTVGGALCMELLTNSGWSAVSSIESVLLQVRMAITSTDPQPARLEHGPSQDYTVGEAVDAYIRACNAHGWAVPPDLKEMAYGGASGSYQGAQVGDFFGPVPGTFAGLHKR